jgi:cytochrome P450
MAKASPEGSCPAAGRLRVVSSHLSAGSAESPDISRFDNKERQALLSVKRPPFFGNETTLLTEAAVLQMADKSASVLDGEPYNVAHNLPGPLMHGGPGAEVRKVATLLEFDRHLAEGSTPMFWEDMIARYCGNKNTSNFSHPHVMKEPRKPGYITNLVIINDPADCERISRAHLMKQPDFQNNGFGHSVISTNDPEKWTKQRSHFTEAFLPNASLAKVFPVSADRAAKCAIRLAELRTDGAGVVDMSDFFLHETQAQLQLAMFGETDEFMDETNARLRASFNGQSDDPMFVRDFIMRLTDRMVANSNGLSAPSHSAATGCPVRGPLGKLIATYDGDYRTLFGNGLIFAFAGHDTTGHTLTWMLMELCRNPATMEKLVAEVDRFVAGKGDTPVVYADLKELPYLTRCILETLRLWPAVGNGTFRTIERDEVISAGPGKTARLPKGTFVQVNSWSRHRCKELWGPDVGMYNPDRDFSDEELWGNAGFAAYNPSSERFSPFTYNPRSCIGMNFAHMEMRLIMIQLLTQFSFQYRPAPGVPQRALAVNRGTVGPRKSPYPSQFNPETGRLQVPIVGMDFDVTPRLVR